MGELPQWMISLTPSLVVGLAVAAHLFVPIPSELHPVTLWNKLATLVAERVNQQGAQGSGDQQQLAGTLAWCLMLLPAIALLWAVRNLVWQPAVFDFTLLFFALGWRELEGFVKRSSALLSEQGKPELRKQLTPLLHRDCERLSLLGLGKACCETLIVGQLRHVVGVLIWYLIAGPIAAAAFRLAVELARTWSPHQAGYKRFGLMANRMVAVAEWPPALVLNLLLLTPRTLRAIQEIAHQARSWRNRATGWTLASIGINHELSLGGPVIYQGQKLARAKLGGRIAPSALHLEQIAMTLRIRLYGLVALILLIFAITGGGI